MPKFSIILPTYNRSFCIKNAVDSVLQQTYDNYELIIIDDGSTDDTEKLINNIYLNELNSKKIIYIKSDHHGVSYTRNIGLDAANNEWIAYIDSDDTYDKDFLLTFSNAIIKNPTCKNFYCKVKYYKPDTIKIIGDNFNYGTHKLSDCQIGTVQYVHHIELTNKICKFDTELIRNEDIDLILSHCRYYIPYFINEVLVHAHYDNSFTHLSRNKDYGYCKLYLKKKHNLK